MRVKIFWIILLCMFFLVACGSKNETQVVNDVTYSYEVITLTVTPISTNTVTITPGKPTITAQPTVTIAPTPSPTVTLIPIGNSLLMGEQIGAENIDNLTMVARWGKGQIRDIIFQPDGKSFIAASAYGYMRYNIEQSEATPEWYPFPEPFFFRYMAFDETGKYLKLFFYQYEWNKPDIEEYLYLDYGTGKTVFIDEKVTELNWIIPVSQVYDGSIADFESEDHKLRFQGRYNEECEGPDGVVYEGMASVGGYLSHSDETKPSLIIDEKFPCYSYWDTASPAGCDVFVFSFCGNALSGIGPQAVFGAFSTDNETLSVMYSFHYGKKPFQMLRTYSTETGRKIIEIGSQEDSLVDFSYSPDDTKFAVAYLDGSVAIWNIQKREIEFFKRDFDAPLEYVNYSFDGTHLIVQRMDEVEIVEATTGVVLSRFEGITSAVSYTENKLATAEKEGAIRLRSIPDGQIIDTLYAHSGPIYNLAFSRDGTVLVSAGEDCKLLLWDVSSGKFMHRLEPVWVNGYGEDFLYSRIFVYYLDYIPGTQQIIGFGSWSNVASWNAQTGEVVYVVESAPLEYYQGMQTINPHFPQDFDISFEDSTFTIAGNLFDLITGELIGTINDGFIQNQECYNSEIITQDGLLRLNLGTGNLDNDLCVLDAKNNEIIKTLPLFPYSIFRGNQVLWMLFSPAGNQLLGITGGGTIEVFQIVN